jgi:simple sugar transport system ATP-binding protein
MMPSPPLLAAQQVTKRFGAVAALQGVSFSVYGGEVSCLLGDNGAGKSTLISILSGVFSPDEGTLELDGKDVRFRGPMDALDRGIATVYQDLAVVPIMPVFRNFWLGREPHRGWGPFRHFDKSRARRIVQHELAQIGISLSDVHRPMSTLSGGQRQCVAIARAAYFGAKVLILDEPTSALGIKEAAIVLRYIQGARDRGLGVVFITHNLHHAMPVGDRFTILEHGTVSATFGKDELALEQVADLISGGKEGRSIREALSEAGRQSRPTHLETPEESGVT